MIPAAGHSPRRSRSLRGFGPRPLASPSPLFQIAIDRLGCAHQAAMVGDSTASDIAGGKAAGMFTIWLDPEGTAAQPDTVDLKSAAWPSCISSGGRPGTKRFRPPLFFRTRPRFRSSVLSSANCPWRMSWTHPKPSQPVPKVRVRRATDRAGKRISLRPASSMLEAIRCAVCILRGRDVVPTTMVQAFDSHADGLCAVGRRGYVANRVGLRSILIKIYAHTYVSSILASHFLWQAELPGTILASLCSETPRPPLATAAALRTDTRRRGRNVRIRPSGDGGQDRRSGRLRVFL